MATITNGDNKVASGCARARRALTDAGASTGGGGAAGGARGGGAAGAHGNLTTGAPTETGPPGYVDTAPRRIDSTRGPPDPKLYNMGHHGAGSGPDPK